MHLVDAIRETLYRNLFFFVYLAFLAPLCIGVFYLDRYLGTDTYQLTALCLLICLGIAWWYSRKTARIINGNRYYKFTEAIAETFRGTVIFLSAVPGLGLIAFVILERMPPPKE